MNSAGDDSIIARSYACRGLLSGSERLLSRRPTNMELRLESRGLLSGSERFRLKGIGGRYRIEAKRVYMGDEMCVLSLLHRYG